MHVAHLINAPNYGGPQKTVLYFTQQLRPPAYQHSVIALQGIRREHAEMVAEYTASGAAVHGLPVNAASVGWIPSYRLQRASRHLIERASSLQFEPILRRIRPDLLHVHTPYMFDVVLRAARNAAIPVLLKIGGALSDWEVITIRRALADAPDHRLRIVAVSVTVRDAAAEALGLTPAQITVIPNGVDLERFQAASADPSWRQQQVIPADALVFGSVGRLSAEKGHDLLLDAFRDLLGTAPHAHLVLVGDGPERAALEQRIARAHLEGRVHLSGFQHDIPSLLKQFDVFVLPSRTEGMSNALLEALASGRPCIATRVGGTSEILPDGVGLLVTPDSASLLDAMRAVCDPALRQRLAAAALTHISQYSRAAYLERYLTLYGEMHSAREQAP